MLQLHRCYKKKEKVGLSLDLTTLYLSLMIGGQSSLKRIQGGNNAFTDTHYRILSNAQYLGEIPCMHQ